MSIRASDAPPRREPTDPVDAGTSGFTSASSSPSSSMSPISSRQSPCLQRHRGQTPSSTVVQKTKRTAVCTFPSASVVGSSSDASSSPSSWYVSSALSSYHNFLGVYSLRTTRTRRRRSFRAVIFRMPSRISWRTSTIPFVCHPPSPCALWLNGPHYQGPTTTFVSSITSLLPRRGWTTSPSSSSSRSRVRS